MLLFVNADFTYCKVHYYITPSLDVSCPQDPCLTLSQFAANSSSYHGNETNMLLFFLPGNHSLDRELSLAHADNFSMTKDAHYETVFVECVSESERFDISETTFVSIKGLHFIGCGGNTVTQVDQFILEDTIFQGMEGSGTALVLNVVAAASIVRSSFLSNTNGSRFEPSINFTAIFKEVLNNVIVSELLKFSDFTYGGALYTACSNVIVNDTKFDRNSAHVGAAIAIFDGNISISNSQFVNNGAISNLTPGYPTFDGRVPDTLMGVISLFESNMSIDSSTFMHDIALIGGVLIACNSSLHVARSTYSYNGAVYGGVMATAESLICVTDSTITNNNALSGGGVMVTVAVSSFNIINSTYTNNSAAIVGGVMYTQ